MEILQNISNVSVHQIESELMLAIFTGTEVLVQGEAEELFSSL